VQQRLLSAARPRIGEKQGEAETCAEKQSTATPQRNPHVTHS
jgi:hypothetical protein